uniref:SlyX family protein n=1 Tax=Ningiella ruwaisensis TaxID=2364274 RepID=UPI00109FFE5D|nr:SlyX family protein [Ningiella ruwaisensis]
MSNTDALQAEIDTLQVKLAYQEDTIEQLNQIVTAQQKQIDRLESLMQQMVKKIQSLQFSEQATNEGIELPPHY